MQRADWERVETIFHEVADLCDDRDKRLGELCGDDAALLAEVQALLMGDALARTSEPDADPHVGLRLGSYTVTRRIARGGMAAVYEGQRNDGTFTQRVAVKIMDLRLSDPTLVAQFKAERQILAELEHPSMTRLVDGGVTSLGEPYLVMEFVDGEPIDCYCDERRLSVTARLDLFAQVCDAVSYAHRALVLHRDLKPSNILVTTEGRAKVVDFGTATLLRPDRLATTSTAPLTPAYASPEQLTGKAVGTASDQYSLGVVLYELLTGVAPFGDRPSLLSAIERALAGTTTTAPHEVVTTAAAQARRTSLARLRHLLSRDLGTIVNKALAPDPRARYTSVQHLADDLRRWVDGAPIEARPPSITYRTTRFVQRHWAASLVAAMLSLGLAVATVVSLRAASSARTQAAEAARQTALAQTESEKARRLNRFLVDMLSTAAPQRGNADARSITVREVLDRATELVETELASMPAVEAEMRSTLGRVYVAIGALDVGRPQLARALALYQRVGDHRGELWTTFAQGLERDRAGQAGEAEALLRGALTRLSRADAPDDPELQALVRIELANALGYQRPGNAETIALLREAIGVADAHHITPASLAVAKHNLGLHLLLSGNVDDAEVSVRAALRQMDALPRPPVERYATMRSLSEILRTRGAYVDAERVAAEAVAGAAEVFSPEYPFHPTIKTSWGRALVALGRLDEADRVLHDAYTSFLKIRPRGHPDLLGPQVGLGALYRRQGRLAASEAILEEARDTILARPGLKDSMPGVAGELGVTLRAMGRTSEAQVLLTEAHQHLQRIYGDGHPSTRRALARMQGVDEEAPTVRVPAASPGQDER